MSEKGARRAAGGLEPVRQRHLARATAVAVAAAAAFLLVLCFSNHPQALERGEEGSASPHGTALHCTQARCAACWLLLRAATGSQGRGAQRGAWHGHNATSMGGGGGAEGGGSGNGTDGSGTARAVRRDPRRGREWEMVTVLVHVHWPLARGEPRTRPARRSAAVHHP